MQISFKPKFIKQFKKLAPSLQDEIREKLVLFKKDPNSPCLKTHKLKGHLCGCSSFSVNYRYRIVFEYSPKNKAVLLCVGGHDVYK